MNSEINLLRATSKRRNTLLSKLNIIRVISLSFLFVISFSSIVLFALIALSPLPGLMQRESDEAKTLVLFDKKIAKILLTKERIGHINTVLGTRPVFADTLQKINGQVPGNLSVDMVKIDGKKVEVTVSGSTLEGIDAFTANIMQLNEKDKRFGKVILTGLALDNDTGRYVLSLELDNV